MDNIFMSVLSIPPAKALMLREYKNASYSLLPWFAAYWANTILWQLLYCLLLMTPPYFMVGLKLEVMAFVEIYATLVLCSVIGTTIGLAVGILSKDVPDAQQKLMPTIVPMLLFSGWVIPYANIPIVFRWIYWISPFQWAFSVLRIIEFNNVEFKDEGCPSNQLPLPNGVLYCTGNQYLARQDLCWNDDCSHTKMAWSYLWLAVTCVLVFSPTYYLVAYKARQRWG